MVTWERVAELALELPEVEASTSWERPSFKVRGKTFAGASRHEGAMFARCDPDERPLLVASSPELYRLTPHFEGAPRSCSSGSSTPRKRMSASACSTRG